MLVAPAILLKDVPPSVETCHWTVGVGVPEAEAVKVALLPTQTEAFDGFPVMAPAVLTVRIAAVVVTGEPQELLSTARKRLLFCAAIVVNDNVGFVPPAMLINVVPPFVEICHWMVAVGTAVEATVKFAVEPAQTVRFEGFVVTTVA